MITTEQIERARESLLDHYDDLEALRENEFAAFVWDAMDTIEELQVEIEELEARAEWDYEHGSKCDCIYCRVPGG